METKAILFEKPQRLSVETLALDAPTAADVVVDIDWSGISTGTERLLWSGDMPNFPGMGYPLVPGYESVGTVVEAGTDSGLLQGQKVFVPGATCYGDVRGLFGGSAARLVTAGARVASIDNACQSEAALLALAATARHAIVGGTTPDLIIGHGVLGRLLARLALLDGGAPPTVWETNPARQGDAALLGYRVIDPATDERRDYRAIYDVSGDSGLLNELIAHLAPGGEITLAGFYKQPLSFAFPPAFMREARLRVAAEWKRADLDAVIAAVDQGRLSLDGLITHTRSVDMAADAYRTAFEDPACLKMVLDWSASA